MRLATHTWGTAGGRVALLVHGMMADHRTWRRVGPALAEQGYHVLGVDLPGHGRSARCIPPTRWEDAAVDDEVRCLRLWDPGTLTVLEPPPGLPASAAVPSLVLLADPSERVGPHQQRQLRARGFTLATVPGAGHSIHRDDFPGFMTSLSGWL